MRRWTGLEAAIAAEEELGFRRLDELIGRFVAEARDAGCSWTEIGARLGVSKQAARRGSGFGQPGAVGRGRSGAGGSTLEPKDRLLACLQAGRPGGPAADGGSRDRHPSLADRAVRGGHRRGRSWRSWAWAGRGRGAPAGGARVVSPLASPRKLRRRQSAEARDGRPPGLRPLALRGECGYVGTEHLLGAPGPRSRGRRARRVLISLQVSIPAIKKETGVLHQPRAASGAAGAARPTAGACSFCGKPSCPGLRLIAGPRRAHLRGVRRAV